MRKTGLLAYRTRSIALSLTTAAWFCSPQVFVVLHVLGSIGKSRSLRPPWTPSGSFWFPALRTLRECELTSSITTIECQNIKKHNFLVSLSLAVHQMMLFQLLAALPFICEFLSMCQFMIWKHCDDETRRHLPSAVGMAEEGWALRLWNSEWTLHSSKAIESAEATLWSDRVLQCLQWLQRWNLTFVESKFQADSRKILIFLHVPLYEPATKAKTVVWNAEEL